MKKPQKASKKKTDGEQVYLHLLNVISHLRHSLKMEYGLMDDKRIHDLTLEKTLLETVKGLDYIQNALHGFFMDEDSFKEIMEWQKNLEWEFKFSSLGSFSS
jgi:hypothetical protein